MKLVKYKALKEKLGSNFLNDLDYTPCSMCDIEREEESCFFPNNKILSVKKMNNLKDNDLICELWLTEA